MPLKAALKAPWGFLPLLFLVPFFLILSRTPRSEDENYSIINGRNILTALVSKDQAFKKEAAEFDAIMGIGTVVTLPVGAAFMASHNVIIARLALTLYVLLYWFSLVLCFQSFCARFAPTVRWKPWEFTVMALTMLFFVQGVPGSYLSQSIAMGEYPGATFFALSLALLFRGKLTWSVVAYSLCLCAKLHFLLYAPLLFFAVAHQSLPASQRQPRSLLRRMVLYGSIFAIIPILIQAMKILAFGWPAYAAAWKSYGDFFIHKSGSGLGSHDPRFTLAVNEWPHYSWREKAYFMLGVFTPVLAVLYYGRKHRRSSPWMLLAAMSIVILVGASHWWFISVVQWWRWTHYFLIPGYAIGIFTAVLETWKLARHRGQALLKIAPWILLTVASYVQIRQTIVGTWQNTKTLTPAQRTFIDWKSPSRVGP